MKKILSLILALAILMQFSFAVSADVGTNLVVNGDFSEDTNIWGAGHWYETGVIVEDSDGNRYLEVDPKDTGFMLPCIKDGVELKKGAYYLAKAKVRAKASKIFTWNIWASFGVATADKDKCKILRTDYTYSEPPAPWRTKDWETVIAQIMIPTGTDATSSWSEWTEISNIIYATQDGPVKIGLYNGRNTGEVTYMCIDDVSIVEIIPEFTIIGADTIQIPGYKEEKPEEYSLDAKLLDKDLPLDSVSFELDDKDKGKAGIFLNGNVLTVNGDAHVGEITVNVKHMENIIPKPITLTHTSEVPEVRDKALTGAVGEGETLKVSCKPYDPYNRSVTAEYRWYGRLENGEWKLLDKKNSDGTWELLNEKCDELKILSGFSYTAVKASINLIVEGGDESGWVDTEPASQPQEPRADNVRISGEMNVGRTVKAEFDFFDANNDKEGTHKYSWWLSESADGDFSTPIGDKEELYLEDAWKNMYIMLKVKPMSVNSVEGGAEEESQPYLVLPYNHIENGSFEEGIEGWKAEKGQGTSAEIPLVRGNEGVNSEKSLEYIQGGAQYPIVRPADGVNLEKNTYYLLSAQVRMKGHTNLMRAGFGLIGTANNNILALYKDGSKFITLPDNWNGIIRDQDVYSYRIEVAEATNKWSDWVKVENIIYAKENAIGAKIGITTASLNATERWNIDDVSMMKLEPTYTVGGAGTIEIPKYHKEADKTEPDKTEVYSIEAKLMDMVLTNEGVVYSLGGKYDGVSINETDGTLTVTNDAHVGDIIIKIKHQENVVEKKVPLTYSAEKKIELRDLKLSGAVAAGQKLTISYDCYDPEDLPTKVEYKWYSKKGEGEWEMITDAEGKPYSLDTYKVPENFDFDSVMAKVVAENEKRYTNEITTNEVTKPTAPTAEKVDIIGKHFVGEELTGTYVFDDINEGDIEAESKYQWYVSDTEKGEYKPIDNANKEKYVLTEKEAGKFIKFGVVPISSNAPQPEEDGKDKVWYSPAFEGPVAPSVSEVRIVGNTKAGSIVTVMYSYLHKYGALEGETVIEWYEGNTKVGTGDSIALTSSMSSVYAKVTAYSAEYPYVGNTAESDKITVSKSSSISGGFGGGGGGSSKPSAKPEATPKPDTKPTPEEPQKPTGFSDITNHWAKETIEKMTKLGYINGVSDTEFKPDRSITRAEFCTIICRAFGITGGENGSFGDVLPGDWFAEYVNAAAEAGLVNGDNLGNFNPNKKITREEMAVIMNNLVKYLDKVLTQSEAAVFDDAENISTWAKEAVDVMAGAGLLKGYAGKFNPKNSATRAEAATVIERLLEVLK